MLQNTLNYKKKKKNQKFKLLKLLLYAAIWGTILVFLSDFPDFGPVTIPIYKLIKTL